MFESLIDYDEVFEESPEMFGFGGVTFKKDFGPYKKGDKVESCGLIHKNLT